MNKKNEALKKLEETTKSFIQNKKQSDAIAKIVKQENETIKRSLIELGLEEYASGEARVFIVRSTKQDLDEDGLILKLKELGLAKGIVKRREYIDLEALENALYHSRINAADIAGCFTEKETISLRIGKVN